MERDAERPRVRSQESTLFVVPTLRVGTPVWDAPRPLRREDRWWAI